MSSDLDISKTAVLCMDYQAGILAGNSGGNTDELLGRASSVLDLARSHGVQVVYVQVGFRDGFPEISQKNAMFSVFVNDPQKRRMFDGPMKDIHPKVAPQTGDIVVTKHRVSAFYATDLDIILRSKDIDTLILFGIATSGVVLSTLTHAVDADYKVVVVADLCRDTDAALHNALLRYFARRGKVIDSADLTALVSAK